ncbi:hypothetical protein ANCCAN_27845, partial [Ancylostoma caninum]
VASFALIFYEEISASRYDIASDAILWSVDFTFHLDTKNGPKKSLCCSIQEKQARFERHLAASFEAVICRKCEAMLKKHLFSMILVKETHLSRYVPMFCHCSLILFPMCAKWLSSAVMFGFAKSMFVTKISDEHDDECVQYRSTRRLSKDIGEDLCWLHLSRGRAGR